MEVVKAVAAAVEGSRSAFLVDRMAAAAMATAVQARVVVAPVVVATAGEEWAVVGMAAVAREVAKGTSGRNLHSRCRMRNCSTRCPDRHHCIHRQSLQQVRMHRSR